jgi:DNA-binding IclR family transcriptional regulator
LRPPSGKLGQVLAALSGKGASLTELVALTGWQPHTTRAALTRLRQRGFAVALGGSDGRKVYQLRAPGQ